MINLNNEYGINIKKISNGKTQNVEVKIGRNIYLADFDKNSASCTVSLYKKMDKNRGDFSKYDADLHSVTVKNDSVLTKRFFEQIAEIEQAQNILRDWQDILSM